MIVCGARFLDLATSLVFVIVFFINSDVIDSNTGDLYTFRHLFNLKKVFLSADAHCPTV